MILLNNFRWRAGRWLALAVAGLLAACGTSTEEMTLRFAATLGERPVGCDSEVSGPAGLRLAGLKLYISELALLRESGNPVPVVLHQDTPWQHQRMALIALADGDACGSGQLNDALVGRVPAGTYTGVSFEVGVPFELNHTNPLTAPAPLDSGAMLWTWQLGHKFVRLDLEGPGDADWFFHLGSEGCDSASSVRPPAVPCRRPNRVRVRLQGDDVGQMRVGMDLLALTRGLALDGDQRCMGGFPDKPVCRRAVQRLGLDPDTGRCRDECREQSVFRLLPPH